MAADGSRLLCLYLADEPPARRVLQGLTHNEQRRCPGVCRGELRDILLAETVADEFKRQRGLPV
jgi:hypothetical protein